MSLRRWLAGFNLTLTLALLGVLFICVNWIGSRRYARWDVTRTKLTQLSDKTMQVLRQINDPLHVIVFYQPTHPLYEMIHDLLDEYQRVSPKLVIQYVDPDQDRAKAMQLAQQFSIDRTNLVVFQASTRHKYLSDTELADYDYGSMEMGMQPTLKSFKGEEAFTSAIISVTQATQPLVWLTNGHGEKSLDGVDATGLSELKKHLEQENMRAESVTLLQKSDVPQDVSAIVIPGPTRRFLDQELLALQQYLEHGGKLLALIDPLQETGLDDLLERWGAQLGHDIVVDPARQLPFMSAANLFVTTYTQHPIVEHMQTLMTLFPLARSVTPVTTKPELTATALAMTSPEGWGETHTSSTTFEFNEGQDLKGPVPIAVAVQRKEAPKTRLVVIGDSDFIVNGQLGNAGNLDLILGCMHWLAEQEHLIGIGPKPLEAIKLNLTGAQMSQIRWLSLGLIPLLCAGLGSSMWWLRRE